MNCLPIASRAHIRSFSFLLRYLRVVFVVVVAVAVFTFYFLVVVALILVPLLWLPLMYWPAEITTVTIT